MRRAKLIVTTDEGIRHVELGEHTTIGRRPESTLLLTDPLVSGQHAYLVYGDGKFRLRDLGSSNGTYLNDNRIEQAVLHHGDQVRMGATRIEFVELEQEAHGLNVSMGADEIGHVHSRVDGREAERFAPLDEVRDIDQLKQDYEKLRIANELNQAIGLETDVDTLLQKILNETFKLLPADRGVILLMNPVTNELEPKAVKHRDGSNEEVVLSRTVIHEVFGTGAAVLTSNAMIDSRFSAAHSVMATGMRSTMCVPMIYRSQIYGIVHLDSLYTTGAFSKKDLQILTGLASQAARAIDNAYKAKEIERAALARRDFERLLPSEVVEQVISGKVQLERGGELRETAVLFSDIRGFTHWSEKHEPTYIVSILNDYFELMVDSIHRHKGTLDKFMGDGIMALFGAPITHGNDSVNAVLCALDMMEGLKQLNARLRAFEQEEVAIGIGINSGPVIAGYMGSSKSMEYTTIGDHVNLAARLCAAAKSGQILLSANTRQAVGDVVIVKGLPPIKVKGKRDPVEIFEVAGKRAEPEHDPSSPRWDDITAS